MLVCLCHARVPRRDTDRDVRALRVRADRDACRAMGVLGTNCRPIARPCLFLRLVAAYWAGVSIAIAAAGRYLSPVAPGPCVDGRPDLVLHPSWVHRTRLRWLKLRAPRYPPPARLYWAASSWALRADHCPGAPPLSPAKMRALSRSRSAGLV